MRGQRSSTSTERPLVSIQPGVGFMAVRQPVGHPWRALEELHEDVEAVHPVLAGGLQVAAHGAKGFGTCKVLKHPLIFRCNLTILRSRSAWLFVAERPGRPSTLSLRGGGP